MSQESWAGSGGCRFIRWGSFPGCWSGVGLGCGAGTLGIEVDRLEGGAVWVPRCQATSGSISLARLHGTAAVRLASCVPADPYGGGLRPSLSRVRAPERDIGGTFPSIWALWFALPSVSRPFAGDSRAAKRDLASNSWTTSLGPVLPDVLGIPFQCMALICVSKAVLWEFVPVSETFSVVFWFMHAGGALTGVAASHSGCTPSGGGAGGGAASGSVTLSMDRSAICRVHASWVAALSIASRLWRTAWTRIRRACADSDVRTIELYWAFSRMTNWMSPAC